MEWRENASRLHAFIKDVTPTPPGFRFPRPAWVKFNRLQTGVGLLRLETRKWGMALSAACECGAKELRAEHAITSCPIYHHLNRASALSDVDESLVTWLKETCPAIKWTIPLSFHLPKRRRKSDLHFESVSNFLIFVAKK